MPRVPKRKQSEPDEVSGGGAGGGTGGRRSSVVSTGVVPRMSMRASYTRRLDELNTNLAAQPALAGIVVFGDPWNHAAFTCTVGTKRYLFNFNDIATLGELLARGEYLERYTAVVNDKVYPRDGFHRLPWVTEFERPMMARRSFFNGVPDEQGGKGTCYLFSSYCAAIFQASGNSVDAVIAATCDDDVGWRAFYRAHAGAFEAVMGIPARLPPPRPGDE